MREQMQIFRKVVSFLTLPAVALYIVYLWIYVFADWVASWWSRKSEEED